MRLFGLWLWHKLKQSLLGLRESRLSLLAACCWPASHPTAHFKSPGGRLLSFYMSYSNPSQHPQRPGILRQGNSYQSSQVVNLSELGLLPRKEGGRPINRRSKLPTSSLPSDPNPDSIRPHSPPAIHTSMNIHSSSTRNPSCFCFSASRHSIPSLS